MIQIVRDFEDISEFHWQGVKSDIFESINKKSKEYRGKNEEFFLKYLKNNYLKDDDNNLIKARPKKLTEISDLIFEETKNHFRDLLDFEFASPFEKFLKLIETDDKIQFVVDFLNQYDKKLLIDVTKLIGTKNGTTINSLLKIITGTTKRITKDDYSGSKLNDLLLKNKTEIDFTLDIQKLLGFSSYIGLSKSKRINKLNKDLEGNYIKKPSPNLGRYIYNKDVIDLMEKVFNYTKFTGEKGFKKSYGSYYQAYDLAKKLDVRVCPYCNMNYTKTVISDKTKISRPDFDHFLEKKRNPFFRLSFWNLIPSCKVCNSTLKNQKETALDTHLHPYLGGFSKDVIFKSSPKSVGNYEVNFDILPTMFGKGRERILGNIKMFKLRETYNDHDDIINEIMWKKVIYNHSFYNTISKEFKELFNSEEEYYRYAFGSYYEEGDFGKRPFAKMTKDLFDDDTFDELDLTELEKKIFGR